MTKQSLRKLYIEKRNNLSEEEINLKSENIKKRLIKHFDLSNRIISIFLPILNKNEINTFLILDLKESYNIKFALPISNFEKKELKHIYFENLEQLKISNYGILEPQYGIEVNPYDFDIVFVPLLCFDKKGYRVGYGKGFYDRFLSKCKSDAIFIGLSFFEQIDDIDDIDEYDIKINYCITPNKLYKFN